MRRRKELKKNIKARTDTSSKKRKVFKKKTVTKRKIAPKTRNAGRWTESEFWQSIRSALRNRTRFWAPKLEALKKARRTSQSPNKRLKWEFMCAECKDWFPQKAVQVHHDVEAGKLNSGEDLAGFVERLFAEQGWTVLCRNCHLEHHKQEKLTKS